MYNPRDLINDYFLLYEWAGSGLRASCLRHPASPAPGAGQEWAPAHTIRPPQRQQTDWILEAQEWPPFVTNGFQRCHVPWVCLCRSSYYVHRPSGNLGNADMLGCSGQLQSLPPCHAACHSSAGTFIKLPALGLEVRSAGPWSSKEAETLTDRGLHCPSKVLFLFVFFFCLFLCQMSKRKDDLLGLKCGL